MVIPEIVEYKGVKYTVTAIADKAAKGNKKLRTLTIGGTVVTIGKGAFNGCTKLSSIRINAESLKSIGKNAFRNVNKNVEVAIAGGIYNSIKKLVTAATNRKPTFRKL